MNQTNMNIEIYDEITADVTLPLVQLTESQFVLLIEAIIIAYGYVEGQYSKSEFYDFDEHKINTLMKIRLNLMIRSDIQLRYFLNHVTHDEPVPYSVGGSNKKRPDFKFYLQELQFINFPIVAEAKILDENGGKTVQLYCTNGILRFVLGEYGWDSRGAIMIAYVRDGSNIFSSLRKFLEEPNSISKYAVNELPVEVSSFSEDVAVSIHDRLFNYPKGQENSPGPIKLRHIWLS